MFSALPDIPRIHCRPDDHVDGLKNFSGLR